MFSKSQEKTTVKIQYLFPNAENKEIIDEQCKYSVPSVGCQVKLNKLPGYYYVTEVIKTIDESNYDVIVVLQQLFIFK